MDEGEVLRVLRARIADGGRLYVAPAIPEAKEARQRTAYLSLLPDDERILLLYDDTFFGGGGDGFVFTARRICWKNQGETPRSCLWGAITPDSVDFEGSRLRISGVEISVNMESEDLPDLVETIRLLAWGEEGEENTSAGLSEGAPFDEDLVLELARRHLGPLDDHYLQGAIPPRKLRRASRVHEDLGPAQVLVLYDDTVFGAGNDGFVVTLEHLLWRNFLESPQQAAWISLDPAIVVLRDGQVQIGERHIELTAKPEEAHQAVARFLRELAGRCRGNWTTGASELVQAQRCGTCRALNEVEEKFCRACGQAL